MGSLFLPHFHAEPPFPSPAWARASEEPTAWFSPTSGNWWCWSPIWTQATRCQPPDSSFFGFFNYNYYFNNNLNPRTFRYTVRPPSPGRGAGGGGGGALQGTRWGRLPGSLQLPRAIYHWGSRNADGWEGRRGALFNVPSQCPPSSVNVQGCPSPVPGHCRDIKEGWGQAPSQPSTPIPGDQGALKLHRKRGQAAGTRPSSCGGPPKAHCEGREAQTEGPLGAGGPSRGTPEEGSCASCSGLARAHSSPFSCSSAAFRSARSRICSFSTSTSSRTANMR